MMITPGIARCPVFGFFCKDLLICIVTRGDNELNIPFQVLFLSRRVVKFEADWSLSRLKSSGNDQKW
jgi:hypothetical protein